MIQSILFWLAAGVGVVALGCLALAVFVIRTLHNYLHKEEE